LTRVVVDTGINHRGVPHCLLDRKMDFEPRGDSRPMLRRVCSLSPQMKSLCESGCLYRSSTLRHLACPSATKQDVCVAPCTPAPCPCSKTDLVVVKPTPTSKDEVRLL
jgi:hypothetical protein